MNFHVANFSCCWEWWLIFKQICLSSYHNPNQNLLPSWHWDRMSIAICHFTHVPFYFLYITTQTLYTSEFMIPSQFLLFTYESEKKIVQSVPKHDIIYFENTRCNSIRNIFHSFIHSLTLLFIHSIFIENQLCIWHCAGC